MVEFCNRSLEGSYEGVFYYVCQIVLNQVLNRKEEQSLFIIKYWYNKRFSSTLSEYKETKNDDMVKKIIYSILLVLFFCGCNYEKASKVSSCKITTKLNSVFIDHVLKLREDCRRTRVTFYITVYNNSDEELLIKRGRKKYYCFWDHLTPDLILKNVATTDSLCLGIPNATSIPPHSNGLLEFIVMNKSFGGSLININKEIDRWISSDFNFNMLENEKCIVRTIKNSSYRKIFMLDDAFVNPQDSLKMNAKFKISVEELKQLSDK